MLTESIEDMNVQLIESKKAVASAIATRSSSNASFYSSASFDSASITNGDDFTPRVFGR